MVDETEREMSTPFMAGRNANFSQPDGVSFSVVFFGNTAK